MALDRVGDIIGRDYARELFGHPDLLHREINEASDNLRQLDELLTDVVQRIDNLYAEDNLDPAEAVLQAQGELEAIADIRARMAFEDARRGAAEERLAGDTRHRNPLYRAVFT